MSRINVGVAPEELSDKHLLAEHREIKRIPNTIKSGKAKIKDIPAEFTLGKGHVKFFYNKLGYLYNRYKLLYAECKRRGFNVTDFSGAWDGLPQELFNDYTETEKDKAIILERIKERSSGK